jgi:hypothetical protein
MINTLMSLGPKDADKVNASANSRENILAE